MGGNIVVPNLGVLIRPEQRGGMYEELGGLAPGFDRTLVDYLEGMTGCVLQANWIGENQGGYTLGVTRYPKGSPVLNIHHLNQLGVVNWVRDLNSWVRDPSAHSLVVDLSEVISQRRRSLVQSLYDLLSTRKLSSLTLVNTDGNFVKPANVHSIEQSYPFKLIPSHVGQGAFACIVGQMLRENGIVRLP